MARRTKAQIATDKAVADACQRLSVGAVINVFDLGKISDAGHRAAANGQDIDTTVAAAVALYSVPAETRTQALLDQVCPPTV